MHNRSFTAIAALALGFCTGLASAASLTATWTQKAPLEQFLSATSPGPRAWTNLTFDSRNGKLALFGGSAGARFVADIWHYDTLNDAWTLIEPQPEDCPGTFGFSGPDGRDAHSTQYDAYNHLYWSIAGSGYKCTGTHPPTRTAQAGSNTTTVVDATLPSDVPTDYYKDWIVQNRAGIAYITSYNPQTKVLTLATPIPGFGPGETYMVKVWTDGGIWYYSPTTRQWAGMVGPHWGYNGPNPEGAFGSNTRAFAYSPVAQAMVLFGGSVNGNTRNDTWLLDLRTKTWALKTANSSFAAPTKRSEVTNAMVYDTRNDVFILFGGRCDASDSRCPATHAPLNDTWAYTVSTNTWTRMNPPVSPPARMGHQMAYDSDNGVVVMFGGTTVDDLYLTFPTVSTTPRDTWVYDYAANTWTEVTPAVSPSGRYIGSLAYDPVAKVSVMYGGLEPAEDIDGRIWTLRLTAQGANQPPAAVFTISPSTGPVETVFAFDGSASRDSDGSIASYAWDFGDGATASGASTSHRYPSNGSFTVTLTVTDDKGATGKQSKTLVVGSTDTTPDSFTFPAVTGVPLNTLVNSAVVTISGINAPAPISITGGEFSVGGGAFTNVSSTVNNGQTVQLRLTSSASNSTQRTATVNIGGVSAVFVVTTVASGSGGPAPFTIAPVSGVTLSTLVTSTTTTISGVTGTVVVSIVGGEYSINNGPFTSANGSLSNGQGVRVRLVSSANYSTTSSATLTVGSASGAFNVTTYAQDTTPDSFAFTAVGGASPNTLTISNGITVWGINAPASISIVGGEYSVSSGAYTAASGSVVKGQTVRVRLTSSASFSTTKSATLTIDTVSGTFSVTTAAIDTTPNAFTFPAATNAALATLVTSSAMTVAGINAPAPISILGGEYSIAGAAYTSAAGNVSNGQSVRVRLTSSASYSTSSTATLTIGGISADFSVTTAAIDTTPNPFAFAAVTGATPGALVTSSAVVIQGINASTPVDINGGDYSINNAPFTNASGNILNGQSVTVRLTASQGYAMQNSAVLTIGGINGQFDVTTVAADTTPNAFAFAPVTDVPLSSLITSTTTTISGINAPTPISIVGGEYSINNGPFTADAGSVVNGNGVRVRLISGSSYSTTTSASVTIGGVAGTFNVTTVAADTTPDAFSFPPTTGAAPDTLITSSGVTVSGINAPTPISVTNGEYNIDGGAFTNAGSTVLKGQTVRVRVLSSSSSGATSSATLTIGGSSATFDVTTR